MPELPEVETVARDLRGLVVGARITGVRVCWPRTLRSQDPEAFAADDRADVVSRRSAGGPSSSWSSSTGDAAITIHLKMTGQLFVVPAGHAGDPYVRLVLEFADGRELRFRDIRKFGRVGLYRARPADRASSSRRARRHGDVFKGFGPEPLDPAFTPAGVPDAAPRPARTAEAAPARPGLPGRRSATSTPTRRSGRRACTRSARPRSLRPADERRLYRAIRPILAEAVERRGSSIDDYTAPDGDGSMQERLPSTSGPASRARAAGARSGGSSSARARPTSARGASGCRRPTGRAPRRSCAAMEPAARPGPRDRGDAGPSSPADGALGLDPRRGGSGRAARPHGPQRSAPPRRRRARGGPGRDGAGGATRRRRLMSILRLDGVQPRGRHVRHPRRDRRRDRARRPDRAGRAERRRQDDAAPDRGRARRARPRRRSSGSAG